MGTWEMLLCSSGVRAMRDISLVFLVLSLCSCHASHVLFGASGDGTTDPGPPDITDTAVDPPSEPELPPADTDSDTISDTHEGRYSSPSAEATGGGS